MDELIGRITDFLTAIGVHAQRAGGTETLPRLREPMAVVFPLKWSLQAVAAGDVLTRSLSGRLLDATVAVDVYAPYAAGGTACLAVVNKILAYFPPPIRDFSIGDPSVGQCSFHKQSDCFICRITLQARAYRCTAGSAS